jgi:predicted phosphodiesterase
MRIVCLSDTHGLHNNMTNPLPEGDVLLHAGDCTNVGKEKEIEEFVHWFQNIKGYDHKIFIAGNHDFGFEHYDGLRIRHSNRAPWLHHLLNEENLSQSDVTYLHDSELIIQSPEFSRPLKIYGSPWQPRFYDWAFNLDRFGKDLEEKWKQIPEDTDILLTHTPPNGIRDFVLNWGGNENVGCELLRQRLEDMNILLNVFGHIHEAYGSSYIKNTMYVNASICNPRYQPINKPIIIDLKEHDGVIFSTYVEE